MIFARCPECGEIAEVRDQFQLPSTSGPLDHVTTMCVRRHWLMLPASRLGTDVTSARANLLSQNRRDWS